MKTLKMKNISKYHDIMTNTIPYLTYREQLDSAIKML